MAWLVFFALVVAVPIALLVWRRRDSVPGAEGNDPQANRNDDADGGPTPHYRGPGTGTENRDAGGNISGTV